MRIALKNWPRICGPPLPPREKVVTRLVRGFVGFRTRLETMQAGKNTSRPARNQPTAITQKKPQPSRRTSSRTRPSGATNEIRIGILPMACVEQLKHGS